MKKLYLIILTCFLYLGSQAQCGAGYTAAALNWDYLDFIVNSGSYAPFITLAQSQNQRFSFGTQGVTFTHNYSTANTLGDVSTHTGEAGSFGAGDDIRFVGDGTVSFTFDNAVQNLKFSLYDVDRKQRIVVSALNGATGTNVTLATVSGSVLSFTNNGTPNARVDATNTSVANTSSDGTVNVTIPGSVTNVTITVTQTNTAGDEDGSYYISDLSACSVGTYPLNYYLPSKPFTGQPAYVISVMDNNIYYTDVASGKSKLLFTDPAGLNINSVAYDVVNHQIYYATSLTANPTINKTIYRYDYETGTKSVFINDVTTLGIPTYYPGVESGAAAFYNGSLYLGVEGAGNPSGGTGSARSGYTNRESTIWKINMNSSYVATDARQVYAIPVDNGSGNGLHDWSDFGINDGTLYDFDGSASDLDLYQTNLLTGATVNYTPTFNPRQVGIDWQGKVYNVGSPAASSTGTIVPYNLTTGVVTAQQYTITYNGASPSGSWGDGAEAFKPKTDFGDAPASYDPAGSDPATHEIVSNLYIGNTVAIEWVKKTSADALGEGSEEDGLSGIYTIPYGLNNISIPVKVFNNTGAAATLIGWIDRNGDGQFQAVEGAVASVPTSAASQTININWTNLLVSVPVGGKTFMRLRLTSTSNGMTTSNPTGYYNNGEVEDWPVNVSLVLPDQKVTLDAQKTNAQKVNLNWKTAAQEGIISYELQKSSNASNWTAINVQTANAAITDATYTFVDASPIVPVSYYRVKITKTDNTIVYTNTKKIDFASQNSIAISPNPAKSYATLSVNSGSAASTNVSIIDFSGRVVYNQLVKINKGSNEIRLPVIQKLSDGLYTVRMPLGEQTLSTSLLIVK